MNAEREVQAQADIGGIEVESGDVANSFQPVENRIPVDTENRRRFFGAATGGKERLKCA